MRYKRYIVIPFLIVFLLLSSGCSRKDQIPRAKMAEINAELFIVDQWLDKNQIYLTAADTSLVYGQVFEKYGYTGDDYMKSLEYYSLDPDRYTRILKKSRMIIEKRREAVIDLILEDDSDRRSGAVLDSLIRNLPPVRYLASVADTANMSIVDTSGMACVFVDTLFFLEDTSACADTLRFIADSTFLARRDSAAMQAVADSLFAADTSAAVCTAVFTELLQIGGGDVTGEFSSDTSGFHQNTLTTDKSNKIK